MELIGNDEHNRTLRHYRRVSCVRYVSNGLAFLGLASLGLPFIWPYSPFPHDTFRFYAVPEVCAFFFFVSGIVGSFLVFAGSRQCYLGMLLLAMIALTICAPVMLLLSAALLYFGKKQCWGAASGNVWPGSNTSELTMICDKLRSPGDNFMRIGSSFELDLVMTMLSMTLWLFALMLFILMWKIVAHMPDIKQISNKRNQLRQMLHEGREERNPDEETPQLVRCDPKIQLRFPLNDTTPHVYMGPRTPSDYTVSDDDEKPEPRTMNFQRTTATRTADDLDTSAHRLLQRQHGYAQLPSPGSLSA
ncbi:unnamed protein product, partial [Mesorhabditis spiculigera]